MIFPTGHDGLGRLWIPAFAGMTRVAGMTGMVGMTGVAGMMGMAGVVVFRLFGVGLGVLVGGMSGGEGLRRGGAVGGGRCVRRWDGFAEPEAEDVGEGWGVFAAGAYADAVEGHGGLAVFVGEGGDEGRAGGRGEFADVGVEGSLGRDRGSGGGDDFQGGRRGVAVAAGSARAGGFAEDQGGRVDALDAELFEAVDYSDNVDEGVGGAEFVEVDVVGVGAVDAGFGGEEGLQDRGGAGAGVIRKGRWLPATVSSICWGV